MAVLEARSRYTEQRDPKTGGQPKALGTKWLLFGSAAVAACLPVCAYAQDNDASSTGAATSQNSAEVPDIIVTAQRRSERLQDLPIAAAAFSGDQLDSKAIDRVSDLQFAAPSLSITDAGETQSVNIRGIGIASNSPNISNGVATYIDGLFQPPIVTGIPFYDVSTIEVLRGPQGTLVGNNSTGGAIFVNSQNPVLDRIEGYVKGGVGNYNSWEGEGALNIPITSTLAIRAAGVIHERDSYYTDVGPYHNKSGKLDEKGGRLGVLWQPGAFRALLKLQLHDSDTGGYAYRPVEGTQFGPYRVGDTRTLSYDAPVSKVERAFIASLELRYEFDNGITVRSLSGYQNKRNRYVSDTDASQAPPAAGGGRISDYFAGEKQYSEEINILSPTDGPFDWILGAYYQHNDIVVDILQTSPPPPVFVQPRNTRDIWGVFAQGNYELTSALELQAGLRYSHYKASGTGAVRLGVDFPGFPPGGIVLADLSGDHQDGMVTGKVALNWKVGDGHLIYGFVARGYKPGGFNNTVSEFAPESVWNYELGWKGEAADGRVKFQLDAYYNDYTNMQLDVIDQLTGTNGVENVANAKIKGIEGQVQARFGGFGIDGGFGYLDTNLSSLTFINSRLLPPGQLGPQCPTGVPSNPPLCFNYNPFIITTSGGPNLYSPKWSYNLGADYRIELGGDTTLTPRINYGYVGSRFNYIAYGPGDLLESRGLLSGSVTLRMSDWTVEAWSTNLTKKEYIVGRSGNNEFYGAPREFGVRASVTF